LPDTITLIEKQKVTLSEVICNIEDARKKLTSIQNAKTIKTKIENMIGKNDRCKMAVQISSANINRQ